MTTRAIVIGTLLVLGVAGASPATAARGVNRLGTSFIDRNDDGVYQDGIDVMLSSLFGPTEEFLEYSASEPGEGLVLEGNLSFVGGFSFYMSGHVRVAGSIKAPYGFLLEAYAWNDPTAAGIDLAPRLRVRTGDYYLFATSGDLAIGDGGRFRSTGDFDYDQFNADGHITVGRNVSISNSNGVKGENEPDLQIFGGSVTINPGLQMRANRNGLIDLLSDTDLVVDGLYATGGIITIGQITSAEPHTVTIRNSYLYEPDPDGYVSIEASCGESCIPHAVTLENTRIQSRGAVYIYPAD